MVRSSSSNSRGIAGVSCSKTRAAASAGYAADAAVETSDARRKPRRELESEGSLGIQCSRERIRTLRGILREQGSDGKREAENRHPDRQIHRSFARKECSLRMTSEFS